ncbi:MAG: AraC family transcriptional regulator [Muribaculum sp.]|nr:AraC family transcriptional regulator [Muribaculum sp.]
MMAFSNKIPEKKLAEITGRRFMLRYNDDGKARVLSDSFHRDDYFLVGVVNSGQYPLSVDFEDYHISEGEAIIISPGQIHASSEDYFGEGFALALAPELLTDKDLSAIIELQFVNRVIKLPESDLHDILDLYEILKRRIENIGEVELALVSAIKSIVIDNIKSVDSIIPYCYQRLAIRFRKLMEQHIRILKSPTKYAALLNVPGVYLNEAIKATTGKSVSNLIGEYVTILAKRELCYTRQNVQEIAYDLGYEDYSYFSRIFRLHSGMSPKAFRDKYLE